MDNLSLDSLDSFFFGDIEFINDKLGFNPILFSLGYVPLHITDHCFVYLCSRIVALRV